MGCSIATFYGIFLQGNVLVGSKGKRMYLAGFMLTQIPQNLSGFADNNLGIM